MRIITFITLLLITQLAWSQNYKFGKVSKEELEEKFYPLDSTANAAVLYSERKTNFEYTYDDGFYMVENYFLRLKIYNKEGFDYATKKILTYHSSNGKEEVNSIKAVTYNLEEGKIIKDKLLKKNIFNEEENKYYNRVKFTLPNLKPGSVVEWKFTIQSPFIYEFDDVELQHEIPIKKLYVKIATPEYLVYNPKIKGYLQVPITRNKKNRTISYTYHVMATGGGSFKNGKSELSFEENIQQIKMSNVPAIKDEYLSGNINNYMSGVKYELSHTAYPRSPLKTYSTTWNAVVEKIYLNSHFGSQLKKSKHFENDIQSLLISAKTIDKKILLIYEFIKQKIKWNEYNSIFSEEGVRAAYKNGVGNVADINLNLVAMLQYAGLDANPVLVSTVKHGIPMFPTQSGFNYVIACVSTPEGDVLLDATEKNAMPNVLPHRVLNFKGRIVRDNGESDWVDLYPKKHTISKSNISVKFDGASFTGTCRKIINNHYQYDYRYKTQDLNKEELVDWINNRIERIEVINARVQNIDDLSKDITETIQFETEGYFEEIAGKTYINPLLYEQILENPFKSEKREFPVFFDKPWAETTTIVIKIPEDYIIETIPESENYTLPENIGGYNYELTKTQNAIQIKSTIVINEPVVVPNHYQNLKEFYKNIIVKQNEKIILSEK